MRYNECKSRKARDGLCFGQLGRCAKCGNQERYDRPKNNGFLCKVCWFNVPASLRDAVDFEFTVYGLSDSYLEAIAEAVYSVRHV